MGVHGLTTFLRENKRSLAYTAEFQSSANDVQVAVTPLVVDTWSFIYSLYKDAGLPWVYGGEYIEFARAVVNVVEAWVAVGLKPHFVFDGPYPPSKIPTARSRLQTSHVTPCLLFFRTSPAARSTPSFLREQQMGSPLLYQACMAALKSFSEERPGVIEIYQADDEADPYAVELAARIGGFVTGLDSDFAVLHADGYRGYIPLDEMTWTAISESESISSVSVGQCEEDDGFQPVKRAKRKKATAHLDGGRGFMPPPVPRSTSAGTPELTLKVSVYTPQTLAAHLSLPIPLLSLVGALVGNDYTSNLPLDTTSSSATYNVLFDRRLSASRRITHAATTLASFIRPPLATKKKAKQKSPQSVMELISMTVSALLGPLTTISSGEQDKIVERVVEGTLPYAIPRPTEGEWGSDVCALHEPLMCPLYTLLSRPPASEEGLDDTEINEDDPVRVNRQQVTRLYISSYLNNSLSPSLLDPLTTHTFWPELCLEDPDKPSPTRTLIGELRAFGYALLQDGTGLIETAIVEDDQDDVAQNGDKGHEYEEDEDELIDVVEEDSDAEDLTSPVIKNLRGALRELQLSDGNQVPDSDPVADAAQGSDSVVGSSSKSPTITYRCIVVEYVRKGSKIVEEEVEVPPLSTFLSSLEPSVPLEDGIPIQLHSAPTRLSVLLSFFSSDTPSMRALRPGWLLVAFSIRWVVKSIGLRNTEARLLKERWTTSEAKAFLRSFDTGASVSTAPPIPNPANDLARSDQVTFSLTERAIQLTSQIISALEAVEHLTQILLLTDIIPPCANLFSGLRFHLALNGAMTPETSFPECLPGDEGSLDGTWNAVSEGLDEYFAPESSLTGPKGKKARRKERKDVSSGATDVGGGGKQTGPTTSKRGKGLYGVLADLDGDA